MDLEKIRNEKGISRSQMVRDLSRHIRGFGINENLLTRYESGVLQEGRMEQIAAAVSRAYPEYAQVALKGRKGKRKKVGFRIIFVSLVIIFFAASVLAQIFFPKHPHFQEFKEIIWLLGGLVAVFGGLVGYVWNSKK